MVALKTAFSKTGEMRYISHPDLMRLLARASRRARLPVAVTKGFSPHLKISIASALKLGKVGLNEEATFYMERSVEPLEFIDSMNENLPEGIRMKTCHEEIKR